MTKLPTFFFIEFQNIFLGIKGNVQAIKMPARGCLFRVVKGT